jgi:hypothetical protein
LKVRAGKRSWCSWLKGAAEKELGWEKRGELHVKGRTRGRQISAIAMCLLNRLCIDGRNVPAPRVSIRESRDVRSEGTVREARVAVGRLGGVTKATGDARARLGAIHILHPEQMRGDKTVPGNMR